MVSFPSGGRLQKLISVRCTHFFSLFSPIAIHSLLGAMAEPSRASRMWKHFKEIWTTGEGHYINENGEAVYGKLPRAKVENPIKVICRPTFMNYLFFFVGWVSRITRDVSLHEN